MTVTCVPGCDESGLFGVQGSCEVSAADNSTVCTCPSKYWGRDDFEDFGDCHLDKEFQNVWRGITCGLHVLCFVLTCVAFMVLVHFWKLIPTLGIKRILFFSSTSASLPLDTDSVANSGSQDLSPSSRRNIRTEKTNWIQTFILFTLVLFLFYTSCVLIYTIPFFYGITRADRQPYQDIALAFGVSSMFVALWSYSYAWYVNLPPLQKYATLFDINSVFLRNPRFIKTTIIARIGIIYIVSFMILYGFNALGLDSQIQRDRLNTTWWVWVGIVCYDLTIQTFYLNRVITNLFRLMLDYGDGGDDSKNAGKVTDEHMTQVARKTLRILQVLRIMIITLLFPTATICILIPFVSFMRANVFFWVNLTFIFGSISILTILVLLMVYSIRRARRAQKPAYSKEQLGLYESSAMYHTSLPPSGLSSSTRGN